MISLRAPTTLQLLLVAASLLFPQFSLAETGRVLNVATVDNFLPCSNEIDGSFSGFSLDLWRLVAEKSKIHYQMSSIPTFDSAIEAAATGKFDLITSCHNFNKERLEVVDFSIPYRSDKFGFLSRKTFEYKSLFIFRIFEDKLLLYSILSLATLSLIGSLVIYKLENKRLIITHLDEEKRSQIFKTWTMFMVGEYGDRSSMHKGMGVIILFFFIRLTVITAVVSSSVAEIFVSRPPDNLDKLTVKTMQGLVDEGIIVQSGSVQEEWLDRKLKNMSIDNSNVVRIDGKEILFVNALETRKVDHILSEVSALRGFRSMTKNPADYFVSAEDPIDRHQAFVFGKELDKATRKKINISLTELANSGELVKLEQAWIP